jgi:hypothetical protein
MRFQKQMNRITDDNPSHEWEVIETKIGRYHHLPQTRIADWA